ncbi:Rne/Rng family ribonuclease [Aestuariivirga sp.]|uniref:Rne/Rng family ribonuclease n=1 Tax=Aestuariivirga sp. TaxID=2650926 RepID=UPI0039E5071C
MGSKMLIDATHAEETRVVVVRGNRIEEFDFESAARRQLKGNIYLAKVTRVEPSLQAAFVEYGGNRHGFLAFSEIHPDYYQIPLADRQALIAEQEAEDAEHDDDDHHHEPRRRAETPAGSEDHPVEAEAAPAEALDAAPEPSLSEDAPADSQDDDDHETEDSGNGEHDHDHEDHVAAPANDVGVPAAHGNGVEFVEEDPESQKVESIGAEDALEEVPQRPRRTPRRQYKIQEVIKRRQVILVQVVKEERGNKGAALTTYLSLAGRYCVLMPNTARGGGISRKITDAGDRRRLKEVARDIEIPQGMGLIVRTAGAQRTKPEIKRDYDYLIRLWESVRDLTLNSTAPALVYEEGSLIKRAIRDLYTRDVEEVQVEGEPAYREAKDFMKMLMPSHAKNVKLYKDTRPLFSRQQVESQLDGLYSPTVTLPSGGYMVINQTEALVAVDINSGKSTREHNIEDTALRTNLEAADEVARQLRLRDLAGLIVIDFIDMEEKRNNRSVERRLKEALKNDRARIQVGRISHFGLMEMSRQRLRPGLLEGSSRTCPHCEGRGIVRSISSCGLSVLRAIEEHLIARKAENLTVKCNKEVAFYILNEKRDNLLSIETQYGISIFLTPSDDVKGSQAVIERAGERNIPPRRVVAAPVRIDSAFKEEEDEDTEEPVAEEVPEETGEGDVSTIDSDDEDEKGDRAEASSEDGERRDGGRRRRRRGRRGGRNGRDRDDERPQRDQQSDVPGLGEQPDVMAVGNGAEDGETPAADAAPREEASENGERRERRGRRDRWGRNRDRNRGPREERPAADTSSDSEQPRDEAPAYVPPPAPVHVPELAVVSAAPPAEPEPRRWQPPQPTIQPAAATERKAGWWSKK